MNDRDIDGREFARLFHAEVVAPVLDRAIPRLRYAAGRLGSGSDVLGFDDAMSRDHDWGCRLNLLVDGADHAARPQIRELLERELPTAGPVFADRTTELGPVRAMLSWYPPDIERYVLAAGWRQVAEAMPLAGRAAGRGDELGSRVLSAQLAGDLMWLAFALSRQWPPYGKWRGTAFRALAIAADLEQPLTAVATAPDWPGRESGLADAREVLLEAQRALGLPAPAPDLEHDFAPGHRSGLVR